MASIEIQSLVKEYTDRRGGVTRVIDDVDLTISGETFVSVVGPSGSGKTTLLNIVSGIETHTSGSVRLRSGATRPGSATCSRIRDCCRGAP